jgi:hypothetical protein
MSEAVELLGFSSKKLGDTVADEVNRLPEDEVLQLAEDMVPAVERAAWKVACLLDRVNQDRLFLPHFASMGEWAKQRLHKRASDLSKLLQAGRFVRMLPAERRAEVMATPPATLYEAGVTKLAKTNLGEAIRLAGQGLPQRELKHAVAARLPEDEHADVERIRTFSLRCRESDFYRFRLITNGIRLQMETPHPTDPEIAEALFADVINYDSVVAHLEPTSERFPLKAIAAGKCACIECGATNGNGLESHHTVPRSVKGRDEHGPYDGTTSPRVWLCRAHHQVVTENIDGTWREWVVRWLARPDLRWFSIDMEAWLGPRKLEDIGR